MSGVDPIFAVFVAGLLTGASEALSVVVTRTVSNASPAQDLTDCAGSLFFGFCPFDTMLSFVATNQFCGNSDNHRLRPCGGRIQKTNPINTIPTILRLTMPRRWLKHGGHANQGHLKSSTITEKVVSEHPHLGAWSYAEVSECIGVPKPSAKNCLPSLSESQSFEGESFGIPFQQPVLVFAVVQRASPSAARN